eukprot:scaffold2495_cov101-Isochrysis_galbana.AAC.10
MIRGWGDPVKDGHLKFIRAEGARPNQTRPHLESFVERAALAGGLVSGARRRRLCISVGGHHHAPPAGGGRQEGAHHEGEHDGERGEQGVVLRAGMTPGVSAHPCMAHLDAWVWAVAIFGGRSTRVRIRRGYNRGWSTRVRIRGVPPR